MTWTMRTAFVVLCMAAACAPVDRPHSTLPPPQPPSEKASPAMTPALPLALETEIDTIRKDPGESVGFGEKADIPYEPNSAPSLIGSDDPLVTQRLLAEARRPGDRVYRLAVLHVLGKRADPSVDAALISLLDDPELRATAAYLLGRVGFKAYPQRVRNVAVVRAALRRYLEDATMFEDPFYRRTFRTQDFILAAYVRVAGPERFRIESPAVADLIGLSLPEFTDVARTELLAQAKHIP